LKDVQNKFSVDRKWWLLRRISQERALQEEWFDENIEEHNYLYRIEAVVEYQCRVEAFQEKILLIMYIVGGQPARASKLIGICYAPWSRYNQYRRVPKELDP
jgi:hypothetical protein